MVCDIWFMETLGSRLKLARERRKLSKREAGKHLGISHVAIGKWEAGENNPGIPNLLAASVLYDVSVSWLITGKEQDSKESKTDKRNSLVDRDLLFSVISAHYDVLKSEHLEQTGGDVARGVLAIYDWALENPNIIPPEMIANPEYARSLIKLMLAGRT